MIRVRCPNCEKNLIVKPELAGRIVLCPGCKTKLKLPAAPKEEVPVVGAAAKDESEEQERQATRRDDDYENDTDDSLVEDRPRRRRGRRRRRRESSGFQLMGMNPFILGVIVVSVLSVLTVGISFAFPPAAFLASSLGSLLTLCGGVWILIIAFTEDTTQGLLCLCVPCYSLFYIFANFDECKRPALIYLIGFIVSVAGAGAAALADR